MDRPLMKPLPALALALLFWLAAMAGASAGNLAILTSDTSYDANTYGDDVYKQMVELGGRAVYVRDKDWAPVYDLSRDPDRTFIFQIINTEDDPAPPAPNTPPLPPLTDMDTTGYGNNVRYIGMLLKSFVVPAPHLETCAAACKDNEYCRFWSFNRETHLCMLVDETGLPAQDECCVSGGRGPD